MNAYELLTKIITAENITAFASVFLAITAWMGLRTWKQKSNAEQINHFLDQLLDEVHLLIQQIQPAISEYTAIKIYADNYEIQTFDLSFSQAGTYNRIYDFQIFDSKYEKYTKYIITKGEEDRKTLSQALDKCKISVAKIESLIAKGQIYNLTDYYKCHNSIESIIWQYNKLQAVVFALSNNLNFDDDEVKNAINSALSTDYKDINKDLGDYNVLLLGFAKDNYAKIYGSINKK